MYNGKLKENHGGCHVESCNNIWYRQLHLSSQILGGFKVDHGHFPLYSNQSLKNLQKFKILKLTNSRHRKMWRISWRFM